MLGCDKTITLIRHIEEKDSDSYRTIVIHGVGYVEQAKLQQDGKTVVGADILTVVLPQDVCCTIPLKDDYIVCGELESQPQSLSELKSCGMNCYRVTAVNDYTGAVLGHWEVIAT